MESGYDTSLSTPRYDGQKKNRYSIQLGGNQGLAYCDVGVVNALV